MGFLENYALSLGVDIGGIKLVLIIYIAYIFAAIHRKYLFGKNSLHQHLYFTLVGLSLLYWNYGFGIIHSLLVITVQWLLFKVVGTSVACVAISFSFQFGYLIAGYVLTSTDGYDITWTMAHCILTLRLIGLCFDVYDGHRDKEKVTPEQKTLMLEDVPGLMEMFGFCYFIGGFNVGPQFSLRRYRLLVGGELTDVPGHRPKSVVPALRRCLSGTLILVLQMMADRYFPADLLFEEKFYESSVFWRIWVICIRGHVLFYQYIAVWIINEGVCILSGLGYHKDGDKVKWDAVRNIKLSRFAFSKSFQEIIESFNINTNQWVARYVFKRLKFLGNKTVSHLATLYFLAIWHGYHEGYISCFTYEFIVMTVERPLRETLQKTELVKSLKSSKMTSWIPKAVGFVYVRLIFGYCVLDFSLRKWRDFYPIYYSVYFYGHFLYLILWILHKIYLSSKKTKSE